MFFFFLYFGRDFFTAPKGNQVLVGTGEGGFPSFGHTWALRGLRGFPGFR